MVSVLILGVGFIGFNVGCALRREGYKVYGMSIDENDRLKMKRNEIIPIICDVSDESKWFNLVETEIDIVIESISSRNPETPKLVLNYLVKLKEIKGDNLTIIFTNASFSFGDNENLIDEKSNSRLNTDGWKAIKEIEDTYRRINAIIIIPTMIYGLNCSYCSYYFECINQSFNNDDNNSAAAEKHIIKTYGNNKKYPNGFYQGFIHIFDLCKFYLLLIKNASKIRGEIFIANSYTERVDDLLKLIYKYHFKSIGIDFDNKNLNNNNNKPISIQYVEAPESDLFLTGMQFNQRLSFKKAETLLGYHPTQPSFIDSIGIYYQSWKESNDSNLADYIISIIPK
ncbi:hypothetical protein DDB_G0291019 [Dictyostelium discoideum AX4]|uniref:NAD-dependent epimerase/dehydratase domain-containing protein n=1 Tax=Dictyostelium discoideum TaxID=44689 RepID=Q54F82_DICDI|nr:hypothetical protein DDB_G0291019 [Dictyostelium discoideum AX4]EAL61940.1 hypothetical protein DDB_G0291019 [Dictyostelium discoideum AX4]|eukprot:XP_635455.1 hypothetical protein DDB_G0291019 [Dictyostelium discoideum AX4]